MKVEHIIISNCHCKHSIYLLLSVSNLTLICEDQYVATDKVLSATLHDRSSRVQGIVKHSSLSRGGRIGRSELPNFLMRYMRSLLPCTLNNLRCHWFDTISIRSGKRQHSSVGRTRLSTTFP